jgi:hypothetical protein
MGAPHLGVTPQRQPPQAAPSVGAHHDQVRRPSLRVFDDELRRSPTDGLEQDTLELRALLACDRFGRDKHLLP